MHTGLQREKKRKRTSWLGNRTCLCLGCSSDVRQILRRKGAEGKTDRQKQQQEQNADGEELFCLVLQFCWLASKSREGERRKRTDRLAAKGSGMGVRAEELRSDLFFLFLSDSWLRHTLRPDILLIYDPVNEGSPGYYMMPYFGRVITQTDGRRNHRRRA
jgi:hypothetical protein